MRRGRRCATRRCAAVERAIRPGGISKVKSARIKAILRAIADGRSGELSLQWLPDAPLPEARDYLLALPGVGRKTAACVLLFAFGLRDVPVDTHVSRVGMRLGLLRAGAPFDQLHDQMLALTPPGHELELHVNLLRHGRRTCFARAARVRSLRAGAHVPEPRAVLRSASEGPPRAALVLSLAVWQHEEGDHRVVQAGGQQHERVEDLVVAEHPR